MASIFADGIATRNATSRRSRRRGTTGTRRTCASTELRHATRAGLVGWAALTPYSSRPAYAGVAEVSIYVAAGRQRRGIGSALLGELVTRTEAAGIWTLQAGIFPENVASLRPTSRTASAWSACASGSAGSTAAGAT